MLLDSSPEPFTAVVRDVCRSLIANGGNPFHLAHLPQSAAGQCVEKLRRGSRKGALSKANQERVLHLVDKYWAGLIHSSRMPSDHSMYETLAE